jgi:hypothetical protein
MTTGREVEINVENGGIGLLGIVFIVLKLTGVIDWSWWWVLLPFYGPLALAIVIGGVWLLREALK